MFYIKRIVVGDGERALLFRNRRFERVLTPGIHKVFDPRNHVDIDLYNLTRLEYTGNKLDTLIARMDQGLSEHFIPADVGITEVGLLMNNGKLIDVLTPGLQRLYWKSDTQIEVRKLPLTGDLRIEPELAQRLRQLGVLGLAAVTVEVPADSVGLCFIDNQLQPLLQPGNYAFWNFQKNVSVEVIDLRVQAMEVAGQELLTRDKVSLRINLGASLRVADPVIARTRVAKYSDYVYRELQFGLRKAVSAKTLDELLGDKASLDADIFAYAHAQTAEMGIELISVGVKDVILPGDMKEILNSVVQAEKTAQANVIRRREEANAARSLLNTAKLIEENPVLMRLKELEALEKITEKIDKLTVFGGLDGVLKQLVTLK